MRSTTLTSHPRPLRGRTAAIPGPPSGAPSLKLADAAALGVPRRAGARPDRPRRHRPGHPAHHRDRNRQVTALLEAEILRERADLAVSGAIGRPRVPVEVNHEPFLTLGIHIGARTTSIVATDLFGRTLDVVETPTPRSAQAAALASLADGARRYLSRWHRRRPLWVGVATGGIGRRRQWAPRPRPAGLGRRPCRTCIGRDARPAGVGGVSRRRDGRGRTTARDAPACAEATTSLYVYARETVGYALSIGGRVHTPASGPGTIAELPAQSELLGGSGQLESTVSDEAVLARPADAHPAGPNEGSPGMTEVLRAARQATTKLKTCSPSGPGCSGKPSRCCATCSTRRSGGRRPSVHRIPRGHGSRRGRVRRSVGVAAPRIRVTAFGNRVQEAGAGMVSLGGLYADPIGAMRRARAAGGRAAGCHRRHWTDLRLRGGSERSCKDDKCRMLWVDAPSNRSAPGPRRVAVLSVHTSPLAQPGFGNAGGMNDAVPAERASAGPSGRGGGDVHLRTSSADPPTVQVAPGCARCATWWPGHRGLESATCQPRCALAAGVLRAEATYEPGHYDIVHSHYWLSGQVGWLARDRWAVPLVHTAHTLAGSRTPRWPTATRLSRRCGRRRTTGGRRGRPVDRQHGTGSAATGFASPRRPGPDRRGPPRRRPTRSSRRSPRRPGRAARRWTRRWWRSSGDPAAQGPRMLLRAAARLAGVRVVVAGGPSGTGLQRRTGWFGSPTNWVSLRG